MKLPSLLRTVFCVLALSTGGCGGGAEPPARPPKIEAVRPTVEKAPPERRP